MIFLQAEAVKDMEAKLEEHEQNQHYLDQLLAMLKDRDPTLLHLINTSLASKYEPFSSIFNFFIPAPMYCNVSRKVVTLVCSVILHKLRSNYMREHQVKLPDVLSYIYNGVCQYNFNYTGRHRGPGAIVIDNYPLNLRGIYTDA